MGAMVWFYAALLASLDVLLRRGFGIRAWLRVALVHLPFAAWAVTGPLMRPQQSRDTSGFSDSFVSSKVFPFLVKLLFPGSKGLVSEDWLKLSTTEVQRWLRGPPAGHGYMVPLHPHGVLPFGAIFNGLTRATGGLQPFTPSGAKLAAALPEEELGSGLNQQLFPRFRVRPAVASGCFWFPGAREFYIRVGGFEVSKPFMVERLRAGDTLAVMPGGATESRFAYPSPHVVYLRSRKGFIRLALEEQAYVIPLYTFGDDEILPQLLHPPKLLVQLQDLLKSSLGLLVPPVPAGLPRLGPKTSVLGVPLDFSDLWPAERGGAVSEEAVDKAHGRYVEALVRLFEANKAHVPGDFKNATLEVL